MSKSLVYLCKSKEWRESEAWATWWVVSEIACRSGMTSQVRDIAPMVGATSGSIKNRTTRLAKMILAQEAKKCTP